jgi:hypothetical protein
MIQRVLLNHQYTGLTCLGLILFMAVFVAALVWVGRRSRTPVYSSLERLPLEDN